MLVTGLKCCKSGAVSMTLSPRFPLFANLESTLIAGHLRDGEDFYPRANFENVIAKLPVGAECIFLFGEIVSSTLLAVRLGGG